MNSDSSSKTDQEDKTEEKKPEIDLSELVFFLRSQVRVVSREVLDHRRREQYHAAQFKEGMTVAYSTLADRLLKGDFNVGMKKENKVVKRKETEYRPRSSRKSNQG